MISKPVHGRKTIKLLKEILKDDNKLSHYDDEEVIYMKRQLSYLQEEKRISKLKEKQSQGFGYWNV